MALCSTCGTDWPDGHSVCPEDGTRLGTSTHATQGTLARAVAQPSPYDEDLAPGSMAGEYRIEKKIGQGAMGSVYGAKHPLIGKRAAIKVIKRELSANPDAVDRFVREAQAVNTIGHPNIVDVFSFGTLPDGRSFFVMEWLHGESLRQRLERPLMYGEAIEIIDTMAKALIAAHEAGVVHRDLKPDNVFLSAVRDEKPVVMLLDFGLAKLTNSEGALEQTRTGIVMGTPLYLSPEQAKGIRIDHATDIYSLGVIMYEMFSGRVPFLADSAVEVMSLHITDAPRPPSQIAPNLPREIDAAVLAMMAKQPSARPTLPVVRATLAALKSLAVSTSLVGGSPAPEPWPRATPLPSGMQLSATIASQDPSAAVAAIATSRTVPPSATLAPRARRTGLIVGSVLAAGVAGAVVFVMLGRTPKSEGMSAPDEGRAGAPVDRATMAPVTPPPPVTPPASVTTPPPVDTPPVDTQPATTAPVTTPPADRAHATPKRPAQLGKVVISIAGARDATILVDGRPVGTGTTRMALALPPGKHTVRATAARHAAAQTIINVSAGDHKTVELTLKKLGSDVNRVEDPFAP